MDQFREFIRACEKGEVDKAKAELVKLRFFAGLTVDQAASAIGVSSRTARRLWVFAQAWLRREMQAAIDREDYERAAELRDQIRKIEGGEQQR